MEISLICIGKIKEQYIVDGINEYTKRIKPFCDFKIIELKEFNNEKALELEADKILEVIKKDDYVVTLEIKGKQLTSPELASFIENHYLYSPRKIIFIIGSSDGLSSRVLDRSDYALSFSRMTFPHQLMRLIFTEQIYRAISIINHQKYHK